jgi:putative membrane protein
MRAKAFNPQIFLEFLCYSVFAGLTLYLAGSGKYLSYVTPRMAPYLYFTAIVMAVWAFTVLGRLFRPQHKVRSAHCFVLVIPILLLLLPHSPLSTSNLSSNYVSGNAFSGGADQSAYGLSGQQSPSGDSGLNKAADIPTEDPAGSSPESTDGDSGIIENNSLSEDPSSTDSIDTQTDAPDDEYSAGLSGLDVANKKITVSNDDFGMWLSEIYMNMEKYEGYTVIMTGFVFKDPEILKEDEFVPARLMMSCCVADLAPAGLLCKYDKVSELEADSWVTVEGTLFIGEYEYDGQIYDDPQISVTKVTPAEEVEGYVYPYY